MGLNVEIKLKDISKAESFDTEDLPFYFLSSKDLQEDADWYNNDPDGIKEKERIYQFKGRHVTPELILSVFPMLKHFGTASFDIGFSRTSNEDMAKSVEFIAKNIDDIEYVRNIDDLIERSGVKPSFDIKSIRYKDPEPEYLPESEQVKFLDHDGVTTVKGMNGTPTVLVFANIGDSPRYLQQKIFANQHNDILKTKDGKPVVGIPTIPLGDASVEVMGNVIQWLSSNFFEESIPSILVKSYGTLAIHMLGAENIKFNNKEEQTECLEHINSLGYSKIDYVEHMKYRDILKNAAVECEDVSMDVG